jgi:hypothetical protein
MSVQTQQLPKPKSRQIAKPAREFLAEKMFSKPDSTIFALHIRNLNEFK